MVLAGRPVSDDLKDLIDHQLEQGVAVTTVKDGTLIFLSLEAMRKMIAMAEEKGQDRVVVFAQRVMPS